MARDDLNVLPKDFLYTVMRDPTADIADRVKAASALIQIEPNGPPRPSVLVRLEVPPELMNGIYEYCAGIQSFCDEQQAYVLSLSRAEQKELVDTVAQFERCNELGVGPLDRMVIKGRT
jgi:hypothetical protein